MKLSSSTSPFSLVEIQTVETLGKGAQITGFGNRNRTVGRVQIAAVRDPLSVGSLLVRNDLLGSVVGVVVDGGVLVFHGPLGSGLVAVVGLRLMLVPLVVGHGLRLRLRDELVVVAGSVHDRLDGSRRRRRDEVPRLELGDLVERPGRQGGRDFRLVVRDFGRGLVDSVWKKIRSKVTINVDSKDERIDCMKYDQMKKIQK